MRIPIRVIGTVTTFLWIFLIAFFVSAVYSVKDLYFNFDAPQMSLNADNEIVFSLPIAITNKGFYDTGSFNVTTQICDKEGFATAYAMTFVPVINKNDKLVVNHNMTIKFNDLLENYQNYLFDDGELEIYAVVGMKIAKIIPVQASTNLSIPWGAPLYNFTLGELEYVNFNVTHLRATVPIRFENHAFFDVVGNMRIRMYNNASVFIDESQKAIEVPQHLVYTEVVEFYVPANDMTDDGFFEVYILTSLFTYGPMVIPYGL